MKVRLSVAALVLAACGPAPEPGEPRLPPVAVVTPTRSEIDRATRRFENLRADFLPWYYEARPVRATELGLYEHDHRLPGMSREAIQERIDGLLDWLARLEQIRFDHLEGDDRHDYAVLEYALRFELLELEESRTWVRDPRVYGEVIARGLAAIADAGRPLDEKVRALSARMAAAPAVLEAARANVASPPALWTELAVEEAAALIRYLESGLAPALDEGYRQDALLPTELVPHRDRLVAALEDHQSWLRESLLPRSTGDYRLGRYLLERRLLYGEHISLSVPELDRINDEAIAELRDRLEEVAGEIDPSRTPRAILDSLAMHGPAPDELLPAAREMAGALREWVRGSGVVPLPDSPLLVVRAMPEFATATEALLSGPGPFTTGPVYFGLAVGDPGSEGGAESDAATGSDPDRRPPVGYAELLSLTAHQTFPGHYIQKLHEREVESELRRVFTPRVFVEGWAHYAEQLVQEVGYGGADPVLRLAQLRRALERHARWYAALHLHALGAPFDAVVERFSEIAYLPEPVAREQVVRATYDPAYLRDALGRLQILELRKDYAVWLDEQGETLSLPDFHERILHLALPLPLAREALIPPPEAGPGRLDLIPPRLMRRRP